MSKKIVFEIIAGLLLLALLVVGVVGFQFYRAPLAEPLSIVQAAPASGGQAQTTPTAAPAAASQKLCDMSGTMSVLMIGRDDYSWEPPYGADAVRLIKINFDNKTVKVFAFERDLLLATPSLEKPHGLAEYRLGPAYTFVRNKEGKKAPGADIKATNAVAQILYDNFGIAADHYLTIEETVLPEVIDTIDGITVNADEAINDGGLNVVVGDQQMDGKTAMLYSRYLKNGLASEDEWGRMQRQASVFKGIAVRLLEPDTFAKIPDLYKQVNKTVVTDLSPQQIQSLACAAKEIPASAVQLKTIESDQVDIEADETMVIKSMDAVKTLIQDFFAN